MRSGRRLPEWLRMERAKGLNYSRVKHLVEKNGLHTICTSGNCPNIGECWNSGTATFMILGDICTRSCKFCNTKSGKPLPPDPDEPERLAMAIKQLGLRHCVITSVDRDDLEDGGALFWSEVVRSVKSVNPGITMETLIPDFNGEEKNLLKIVEAGPEVISHNVETVRRLTPSFRSRASYDRSLNVIKYLSDFNVVTKSGLMVGLGEKEEEVIETMDDFLLSGCKVLTIGQYLQPSAKHMEPYEYVEPGKFDEYREIALEKGFEFVESSPLVRSSFHAERHVRPH